MNTDMKPRQKSAGVVNRIFAPYTVPIRQKRKDRRWNGDEQRRHGE